MPTWGDVFNRGVEGGDAALRCRRIEAIVDHLQRIQVGAEF